MTSSPEVSDGYAGSASICREAIREVFTISGSSLSAGEVRSRVPHAYPGRWAPESVTADLVGSTVNLPSSRHYPTARRYAFLFRQDDDRYRLWNPASDGHWRVTASGVERIDEDQTTEVTELSGDTSPATTGEAISNGALSLERDLEACLLSCISQLELGLRLCDNPRVRAQQFDTGVVGRLDLLATDERGKYVVIELKAGTADDRVCGQVLRYMGWVKLNLAEPEDDVRGIIVAHDFTDGLRYAAAAIPQLRLKRYSVSFQFADAAANQAGDYSS
jgi:hypothetical protein